MSDFLKLVKSNEEIKKLKLSDEVINKNLITLVRYVQKKELCNNCKGLRECKQSSTGYTPYLKGNNDVYLYDFKPCDYLQTIIDENERQERLTCIGCNFDEYNFDGIYVNDQRKNVLQIIKKHIMQYQKNEYSKGIYLHGAYGTGKSYLLAYLADKLTYLGAEVVFAYYPDFVRQVKSSIANGTLEELINLVKDAEILIFDDFGGEVMTPFIRDEVLMVILQQRMVTKSLTFMSSNLDFASLKEHLATTANEKDEVKASRILERIQSLMDFVELKDENYRRS